MKLVLASTSPFRKALLDQARIPVETVAPDVDESLTKSKIPQPKKLAETLAELKARSGFEKAGRPWVIGSDQVACLDDQIFDKPGTREKAIETLELLQGQTHQLITSVCLISPGGEHLWTNITTLKMRPLNREQIENYVDLDQPLNCAGSYMLEKAGIRLFEDIQSSDFTAIQGLPMIELCNQLYRLGFDWKN